VLDPYSPARLVAVTAVVALAAFAVACLALWRLEGAAPAAAADAGAASARPDFRAALREVWSEPPARRFTVFVFVSMLAYSAQDLILEPFAGAAFGMTPGQSTALAGVQHGGALLGMIVVALAGHRFAGRALGSLRGWTVGGCLASALALAALATAGWVGPGWPLRANVFALGAANGAFAIAAIASMMRLAGDGHAAREGVRMGLWGAAQAVAFGLGGLGGAAASDLARQFVGAAGPAYGLVFAAEALLFVASARLARRIGDAPAAAMPAPRVAAGAMRPSEAA
jgi:BCD family chlorophyll transporter-like MFS transporter